VSSGLTGSSDASAFKGGHRQLWEIVGDGTGRESKREMDHGGKNMDLKTIGRVHEHMKQLNG
jgi:hypothetical protein